ncbi:MAG: hypothetical protein M0Z61_03300 [Nitrospiraceae bacterium]|nr:hypothetical protein [Nitrospiraceae bacterium]
MTEIKKLTEAEIEALKFLDRDFDQCFQQMRYYDAQIFDVLKFLFTAYSALIGIALGLYQLKIREHIDLTLPSVAAIIVGLIIGLFMFALTVRNRVYYVQVARYVNNQRDFFFKFKPLGFENRTKMYTKHNQPPYFNWRSSQSILYVIIACLNSILLGILLFMSCSQYVNRWIFVSIGLGIFFILQMTSAVWYLISRENKSASKAVFGKE